MLDFQRIEARVCLLRLRREVLDGLTVFRQLAVGAERALHGLLCLSGGVLQALDVLVEGLQVAGAAVERAETLADLVELCRDVGHLPVDMLE